MYSEYSVTGSSGQMINVTSNITNIANISLTTTTTPTTTSTSTTINTPPSTTIEPTGPAPPSATSVPSLSMTIETASVISSHQVTESVTGSTTANGKSLCYLLFTIYYLFLYRIFLLDTGKYSHHSNQFTVCVTVSNWCCTGWLLLVYHKQEKEVQKHIGRFWYCKSVKNNVYYQLVVSFQFKGKKWRCVCNIQQSTTDCITKWTLLKRLQCWPHILSTHWRMGNTFWHDRVWSLVGRRLFWWSLFGQIETGV